MDEVLISIVIPAYNEETLIGQTLDRVRRAIDENQNGLFSWEAIVVDNNSSDKTAEIASRNGADIVFEPVNHISRARNKGANAARGDWLLFIDADTHPLPGLVADTLDVIRSGRHVGCSSTVKVEGGPAWYRRSLEGHNLEMRLLKSGVGAYLLCSTTAFRAIGGFNTDLHALEELDFVKRLKAYGRKAGKFYTVLHKHPVITSGRKGNLHSRFDMSKSLTIAFWHLLTKRIVKDPGKLSYWYADRR